MVVQKQDSDERCHSIKSNEKEKLTRIRGQMYYSYQITNRRNGTGTTATNCMVP
jgi:hypothetical protein